MRIFSRNDEFGAIEIGTGHDWGDLNNYVGVYGNKVVDKFGAVHSMLSVQWPRSDVSSDELIAEVQEAVRQLLIQLPTGIAQIQFISTRNGDYKPLVEEFVTYGRIPGLISTIRDDDAERLKKRIRNRKLVRTETHIVLSAIPKNQLTSDLDRKVGSGGLAIVRRKRITKEEHERCVNTLTMAEKMVEEIIRRVKGAMSILSASDIAGYFFRLWNPGLAFDHSVRMIYDYDSMPFIDAWMVQEMEVMEDAVRIGGYYHMLVSMAAKPLQTRPKTQDIGFLIQNLGITDIRITTQIRRLDKQLEQIRLGKRINSAVAVKRLGISLLETIINPHKDRTEESGKHNVSANTDIEEAEALLKDMRDNTEELVQVDLSFHIWGKSIQELLQRRVKILVALGNMGNTCGWEERKTLLPVMLSSMPCNFAPLERDMRMRARMAADLCSIGRGLESDEAPVHVFGNSEDGLVTLDLRNRRHATAPMVYVSGATGTGKSVLVNQLAMRHLQLGGVFICFDKGSSYYRLIEALGGIKITFNGEKPSCFNIFQVFGAGTSANGTVLEPENGYLGKICNGIEILLTARETTPLLPAERNLLEVLVRQVFANAAKDRDRVVTLSHLAKQMREHADARDLLERIRPYLKGGAYGMWFDGPSDVSLNAENLLIDFSRVKTDQDLMAAIVPLMTLFISDLIYRNYGKPMLIIFGELWEFIKTKKTAELMIEAFRTYRKLGCIVIGESQTIAELYQNPEVAAAILQGAQTWVLLPQGKEAHIAEAIKALHLSQGQEEILRTLQSRTILNGNDTIQYREALLKRGESSDQITGRVRIDISPLTYWLTTTAPEDSNVLTSILPVCGGDMGKAIEMLSKKYPGGVSYN